MFVGEEHNKMSLLEIKKLKQQVKKISNTIKKRKISNLMFNVMFIFYIIMVLPILGLIGFIKYTFWY